MNCSRLSYEKFITQFNDTSDLCMAEAFRQTSLAKAHNRILTRTHYDKSEMVIRELMIFGETEYEQKVHVVDLDKLDRRTKKYRDAMKAAQGKQLIGTMEINEAKRVYGPFMEEHGGILNGIFRNPSASGVGISWNTKMPQVAWLPKWDGVNLVNIEFCNRLSKNKLMEHIIENGIHVKIAMQCAGLQAENVRDINTYIVFVSREDPVEFAIASVSDTLRKTGNQDYERTLTRYADAFRRSHFPTITEEQGIFAL